MRSASILMLRTFLRVAVAVQRSYRSNAAMDRVVTASRLTLDPDERESLRGVLAIRSRLTESRRLLKPVDYGSGSALGKAGSRSVGSIHEVAATPHAWGTFLFKLIRSFRPGHVLELGTSLGVSASYMQHALSLNQQPSRLVTLEGDGTLCEIARDVLGQKPHVETQVIEGPFAETLDSAALNLAPIDFVFVDGHHETDASISYFKTLLKYVEDNAVVVFDDIEPRRGGVAGAWKTVRGHQRTRAAFHLGKMGLAVVSQE